MIEVSQFTKWGRLYFYCLNALLAHLKFWFNWQLLYAGRNAMITCIHEYINLFWQILVDFCDTSKLYYFQNIVKTPYHFHLKSQNKNIISKICIGLSMLSHIYFLKGGEHLIILSAHYVIALWLYNIFSGIVLTTYPWRNYF